MRILIGMLGILLATGGAQGALYIETFDGGNTQIPEGNPTGMTFSGNVSDVQSGATVGGLTVSFNVSGGFNGGLYVYVVAPNGAMVVLLNQPGVSEGANFGSGYGGAGFNVTLSDSGPSSIQTTPETDGAVFSGTYSAAGSLSGLNGSAANGTWNLFFADEASGPVSTLNNWSLGITAVPEPVTQALIVFGAGNLLMLIVRQCRMRLRGRRRRTGTHG